MTVYEPPNAANRALSVAALLDDGELGLDIRLVAGRQGLDRVVDHPRIQKSGLALAGHLHGIVPTRVQILGETELSFLEKLAPEAQREAARHLFRVGLSLVVITRGADPPRALLEEAERTSTPLVVCAERSSRAITALHSLLDERLAPRARVHGVLVDVFEVGVLLLGKSGIGKSECALELVMRGHRLVADDVIECDYKPPGMVFGQPAALLRYHIEVRGLGILNIKDLYGVTAVRERKRVDLLVRLELWQDEHSPYDRLGIEDRFTEILGVPIREVTVPVRPGRNMSSIIEIAARDELLRQAGHHPAREFIERVDAETRRLSEPPGMPFRSGRAPESSAPPPVIDRGERAERARGAGRTEVPTPSSSKRERKK
jgi:HPr kinase/phosphorylase